MKKGKLTDFLLTISALVVSATVALLAAIKTIEANTAIVFLGLCVACIAVSLIDLESPIGRSKKSRKK